MHYPLVLSPFGSSNIASGIKEKQKTVLDYWRSFQIHLEKCREVEL